MRFAVLFLMSLPWACRAAEPATASGPVQVEPGNLLVLQPASGAAKWIVMPHAGGSYSLYLVTIGPAGEVGVGVHPLPIGGGPTDPPPASLASLVRGWANEANDPENRAKLSAAYLATIQLVDGGQVTSPEQLVALQKLANTTLLGPAASQWTAFFTRLAGHLDAHTPADLAGYRAAWLSIAEGLR
jgi:hypothetical protein